MRGWLQKLVNQYLPAVERLTHDPDDRALALTLAEAMKQAWVKHGFASLKQQHSLMTAVRGAIKAQLGEDHIAFETMNFSTEEWIEINRTTSQRVANQNANQVILDPTTVNAIVTRATNLLGSREWAEIAAGLVVLTGRRSAEVLKTASFEYKTEFSVMFTGSLKRKGEETLLSFEIPTLCQAQYVIKAWSKLRQILPTSELTNVQVNQRYADDVAKVCDRAFADLVQPVEGREKLYSHLFRKIYATIATYFYCPAAVDEAEFRAEIQGHFSGHESLSLAERRSIASDRHYRSYVIQDQNGNMRKGIRLTWQGVQVIEAFRKIDIEPIELIEPLEQEEESMAPQPKHKLREDQENYPNNSSPEGTTEKRQRSLLSTYADEHDRWMEVLDIIAPDLVKQQDKTSALLDWIEQWLDEEEEAETEERSASTTEEGMVIVADQARTLAWLTGEIESLRAKVVELEQERDAIVAQGQQESNHSELERLEKENAQLRQERDEAVAKLETFRTLLNGGTGQPERTVASTIASVPPRGVPQTRVERPKRDLAEVVEDEEDLDPEVVRALYALMQFNDAQTNHADKWAISFPVMKELCKQVGVATQPKIDAVFKAKADEIDQHHRDHGLGQRHNRVHQGQSISDFIRL
jgi:hypothetical protein